MSLLIENVHTFYGLVHALTGVSLKVPQHGIVALLGGNGSGKTTIINTINGFIQPKEGIIEFNGKRIDGLPVDKIAGMGITQVPQGREIFPEMTVRENLELGAYVTKDKALIKDSFEKVYTYFPRLKQRHSQMAGSLSGGEQQMLALGRGIMARPLLMLMDEPSAGLAPMLVSKIYDVIKEMKKEGNTILLVEQNIHMALAISEYYYLLKNGKIVLEGSVGTLLAEQVKETFFSGAEIDNFMEAG